MAAVAPSCRLAKMASERAKLCVSGPLMLLKSGPGIVAGNGLEIGTALRAAA